MSVRIDAHHHLWDLAHRPQPWTQGMPVLHRSFGFEELAPQLRDQDVAASVVVQSLASLDETHDLLTLADTEEEIAGVVGWFDLEARNLPDMLAAVTGPPGGEHLVGVRHQLQAEPDKDWLARPAVRRGLAHLAAHGLTFDLVVSPEQLPAVTRVVAAMPDTAFVLDHAGKPPIASGNLRAWADDLAALADLDNTAVKLSGLVTEASWTAWTIDDLRPAADAVLAAFGADRVMFGSDWPVCLVANASYDVVAHTFDELVTGLSTAERSLVWGGTAARVYGLEVA